MSNPFELWRGITVSDSADDVRRKFPDAVGDTDLDLGYYEIAGHQFQARWHYWRDVDPKVTLQLVEHSLDLRDLSKSVRRIFSLKYGRGKAIANYNNTERKIWDQRYVRVQMTVIYDHQLPTMCIEYFRPLYLGDNLWAEEIMPSLKNV